MKRQITFFFKKNSLPIFLSFSLPISVMAVAYYQLGIYPGSELSLLASDAFAQYASFHASLNNVLHGKQNIFYTWSGSLGLNYWSLMAYYLNGIFTPLVVLFDNIDMPEVLYFLTLLKFGASGVSFWIFAHNTYRINRWLVVGLSVSYSLMAYTVGYSEVIMWLDTFVYLPLIILGMHRLMDQKKPVLLFISYLLMFLSNFYMAFIVGTFSFLYYWARTSTSWSTYKSTIKLYFLTAFLAGGASMITILPTIIDLANNGESLTAVASFFTKDVGIWDLVAKNIVGVYDTSQYESMPFVYIGLMPLLFCVYYFSSRNIRLKNKLIYGSLIVCLIASIYILPLNLFWHGLHSPYMFLFRFSFLLSFLVILLAGHGLEVYDKAELNIFVNGVLGVEGLFLIFFFLSNKKRYGFITTESLIVTFVLLGVYLLFGLAMNISGKWQKWLPFLLLIVMTGEAYVNSHAMLLGIKEDWGFPKKEMYTNHFSDIQQLVDQANEQNSTFFRLENLDPVSSNDSFIHGYHGVSMFSSIRNRHSSQYVNALGFRSLGTNLQVQYPNNTLFGDALVGMKYNISKSDPLKFGYEKISNKGEYNLYQNKYTLPLGILTDKGIYGENAVVNQTELFNHLSGMDGEMFLFREAALIHSTNAIVTENEKTIDIGEKDLNQPKSVTWLVTVPAKTQGYLSIVPTNLSETTGMDIYFTVDNITHKTSLPDSGQYYNIGYYDKTTSVRVTATFPRGRREQQAVTLYRPDAIFLQTDKYAEAIQKIQKNGIDMQVNGRTAQAEVSLSEQKVLLTTIPYDKGWKVYIDGERTDISTFKDAFLSVIVPKGNHEIKFVFLPQGFVIGAILFIGCNLVFWSYVILMNRKRRIIQINSLEQKEVSER